MIKTYLTYVLIACIPIAGYFGYDYGVANTKENMQSAADKLTNNSVKEADKLEVVKVKERIVYRDIIKTVETSNDPTKCLDAHPGNDIADSVRKLQSL
jgi:hypothetical protein